MRLSAFSAPAVLGAINEDWVSASSGLIVVIDGATIRTDTGCTHGAAWYAMQLGSALSASASNRQASLPAALRSAIRHVADQHPGCNLTHPGTPSAAVAVLRSGGDELEYLILGDITVVLEGVDGGLKVVVDDRVNLTARLERDDAARHLIGSPEKRSALVRMKRAELAVRNRLGGYWVAAADPSVVNRAFTGAAKLNAVRRTAVLSDGAARLVSLFEVVDWIELLDSLDQAGPHELIRRVRAVEATDPDGQRWPRNKRSDDATVVYADSLSPARLPL